MNELLEKTEEFWEALVDLDSAIRDMKRSPMLDRWLEEDFLYEVYKELDEEEPDVEMLLADLEREQEEMFKKYLDTLENQ